jgi:hypothetical protein
VDDKESDALAYVQFNGLLFSLDAILPLTDLGQRKNWIFEPVANPEDKVKNNKANWRYDLNAWGHDYLRGLVFNRYVLLFYADAVFGSMVTSMFLAGLVGLIANRY